WGRGSPRGGGAPRHPGEVPAGSGEARDETRADGIAHGRHDKRDRRRGSLEGQGCGRASRDDHVHLEGKELGNELGEALVLALRPAILDNDGAAPDVTEGTQPVAKRSDEIGLEVRAGVPEEADTVDLPRLLRLGGERRGEEPAGHTADERSSGGHSIT